MATTSPLPTLPTFTLANRTIVITGAASGLGAHLSHTIAASGASVALADINPAGLSAVLGSIQSTVPTAGKISKHVVDVSDEASVAGCLEEVVGVHGGGVDGLVSCAGIVENYRAEEYPMERVRKLWGVNVDGTWLAAVKCKEVMKKGGSMVFIGSMSGAIVNVPQRQTPYNASKAAVRHMAASLAVEWAEDNIRVNCISPGYMRTALTERILLEKPELQVPWVDGTPMKRMGNPDDLDGPVVFLLSEAAKFVTGAEIRVDGGYSVV